jgi:ethanolamine utilization cobalamin adenosyltransferase
MIKDLFNSGIDRVEGMDKNNRIVIKPLGAINNKGNTFIFITFRKMALKTKIDTVIAEAQTMLSILSNSLV